MSLLLSFFRKLDPQLFFSPEPEVDAEVCPERDGGSLHRGDERGHQQVEVQPGVSRIKLLPRRQRRCGKIS